MPNSFRMEYEHPPVSTALIWTGLRIQEQSIVAQVFVHCMSDIHYSLFAPLLQITPNLEILKRAFHLCFVTNLPLKTNFTSPSSSDLAGSVSSLMDTLERRSITEPPKSVGEKRARNEFLDERRRADSKQGARPQRIRCEKPAQSPRQAPEVSAAELNAMEYQRNKLVKKARRNAATQKLNPDIDRKPARRNIVQPSKTTIELLIPEGSKNKLRQLSYLEPVNWYSRPSVTALNLLENRDFPYLSASTTEIRSRYTFFSRRGRCLAKGSYCGPEESNGNLG